MPRSGGLARRVVEVGVQRVMGVDLDEQESLRSKLVEAVGAARLADRMNRRLGWLALNAVSRWTQGQDLEPEDRISIAQRVRAIAKRDAQMMYAVRLRVAFCFGRGVPEPKAPDEEVQAVLTDFWDSRPNQAELTSAAAQWRLGKDLYETMNVYLVVFGSNNRESLDGRILLGSLQHDQVRKVVRDPTNWRRVLYYVVTEYVYEWDYSKHAPKPDPTTRQVYYEALDGMAELEEELANGRTNVPPPPPSLILRPGRVLHIATNRGREQAFGEPEMRTNLRWASAFNDLLAGQVEKAKAAQQYLMKVSAGGAKTEQQLQDVAMRAVGRRSPLANADLGDDEPMARNVHPGSQFWGNEGLTAEPFNLDSGAAAAKQDLESASHAFASGTNYPGHYFFGDPGSLAGSLAVELPVLKLTDVDQQLMADQFRALCDLRIRRAIDVGVLSERRTPTQDELDAGMEVDPDGMVERDLSYELKMPDPLRRNLPELMTLVSDIAVTFDPTGQSEPLNRALLGYALDLLDMSDAPALIEAIYANRNDKMGGGAQDASGNTTTTGPDGLQHGSANPVGARRTSAPVVEAVSRLWQVVAAEQAQQQHDEEQALLALATGNGSA